MTQLTINIKEDVKDKLQLLAKSRNSSVSDVIEDLIDKETGEGKVKPSKKGLGTYLSELPLKEVPEFNNEREFLGKMKEENQLHENIH